MGGAQAQGMHTENHYYGHAGILRAYCGLAAGDRRPLAGCLQHGWQPGTGLGASPPPTPWRRFIWSRRNLEACRAAGLRRVVPIGSPLLYLPGSADAAPAPRSLLALPFHGWERARVGSIREGYVAYADELDGLRRKGEFDRITVCLYWLEHEDAALREVFTLRGCEVVTAGHRDENPDFLPQLRRLILAHACTTANRIATCTFYALHLGRPFFRFGPAMDLGDGSEAARFRAWEEAEFPTLLHENFDGRPQPELGAHELGLEFRQSPEALRRLLGLSGRRLDIALWQAARSVWRLGRKAAP